MNEREVECSRCDSTTLAMQEGIQSDWFYVEPGWAAINGMIFCPKCKERYLKHHVILGESMRKYPDLVMYPCE